jgi:predicted nuclease of predicted toxin-antitoxin system
LVQIAHAAGHLAAHVNYLGLGSSKDWQLMATIRAQNYTFVTNNRSDFLARHGQEPLHAGVIIIVTSVTPARQRELFNAALKHVSARDLTNTVVEVQYAGTRIECSEYDLPKAGQ